MKRTCIAAVAIGLMTATTATMATASDDWPTRPVRVISTFAAGGTADILARIVAEHLTKAFKQQFYVEVRAGAGGQIGVRAMMEMEPDGYNLAITNVSHLVLHPMTRKDVTYDPQKDMTNIAFVGGSPVVLSVNPKSGFKSLKEFIDRAKKEPQTYSSSGLGSMGHLFAMGLTNLAKIKTDHIPYKGASQALSDLVGGHIVFSSQTVSSTAQYMRAGTLQGLALSHSERLSDWPDIPTFKEQGYDMEASIWFALSGPKGMPDDLVKRINEVVNKSLTSGETAERMRKDGLIMQAMTPDEFRKFIDQEHERWLPVVKESGLYVAN